MEINEVLTKIGLIPSETKLYLALLDLGPSGANLLAKRTEIKRANVYYFLESLKDKGLINQFTDMAGIKKFRAESPEKLLSLIENQEKELENKKEAVSHIIPELKQIFHKKAYQIPKVRYYEGKKAVERLYDEIFKSKEIFAIANIDSVGEIFPHYTWGLKKLLLAKKVILKELVANTASAVKYQKELSDKYHTIKILPKDLQFETDILLYHKKVAFISYRQVITAFVIEDVLIFEAEKNIFEGLWKK